MGQAQQCSCCEAYGAKVIHDTVQADDAEPLHSSESGQSMGSKSAPVVAVPATVALSDRMSAADSMPLLEPVSNAEYESEFRAGPLMESVHTSMSFGPGCATEHNLSDLHNLSDCSTQMSLMARKAVLEDLRDPELRRVVSEASHDFLPIFSSQSLMRDEAEAGTGSIPDGRVPLFPRDGDSPTRTSRRHTEVGRISLQSQQNDLAEVTREKSRTSSFMADVPSIGTVRASLHDVTKAARRLSLQTSGKCKLTPIAKGRAAEIYQAMLTNGEGLVSREELAKTLQNCFGEHVREFVRKGKSHVPQQEFLNVCGMVKHAGYTDDEILELLDESLASAGCLTDGLSPEDAAFS